MTIPSTNLKSTLDLPVIDLTAYLDNPNSEEGKRQALLAAESLKLYSACAIRDPRITEKNNSDFLDLMEDYFNSPIEEKMKDVRKEYSYQVGATPELTEVPKCGSDKQCQEFIAKLNVEDKPKPCHFPDPKWRFFWRMGNRPSNTRFTELNADQVRPQKFPQWESVMNNWGQLLLDSVTTLASMVAIGLELPASTFSHMSEGGPHLLAPTATDLQKFGKEGTVLAGFHYDLNFLTIHGKSRFPGLHIWERNGKKLLAKIPNGCLLVQAGKQMEWLTGGVIKAGYHEVVIVEETMPAIEKQKQAGRPLWRISSTLFYHIASDQPLKPIEQFATKDAVAIYPEILTGDHVKLELGLINLSTSV